MTKESKKASEYGRHLVDQMLFKRAAKRALSEGGLKDVLARIEGGGIRAALEDGDEERETRLRVVAEGDDGLGIYLSGVIGLDVTDDDVVEALGDGQADGKQVNIYINSPGGGAAEGISIANKFARFAPGYTAIVDGLAGSAATITAVRGGDLLFEPASEWLVHEAAFQSLCFSATATEMEERLVPSLRATNNEMAKLYAERTGKSVDDMLALMAQDRVISSTDAVELGFGKMRSGLDKGEKPATSSTAWYDEGRIAAFADVFTERAKALGGKLQ